MSASASQTANLQCSHLPKIFQRFSSPSLPHSNWALDKASLRPNESPDLPRLLLQTSANTADQQKHSLASLNPVAIRHGLVQDYSDAFLRQRITLAHLVKGVYELQYRRLQGLSSKKRSSARSLWESVHFELVDEGEHLLLQPQDTDIDLAVYRWKPSNSAGACLAPPRRRVVIAIRGTLPSMDDGWHNFQGSLQCLHLTPRYRKILEVVKTAVESYGSDEICIAGHSLGAALGLLVARALAAEERIHIESHLFNPVYAYTWIPTSDEILENEGLWRTLRAVRCATVAGMASVLIDDASRVKIANEYSQLQDWTPHVYINTGDPICRGYWEYFTNHERLARNGALGAYFAYLAAPFSARGLLTTLLGSKPSHLIPSAILHVCEGVPPDWLGTDFSNRSRYSNHNLARWMVEDLPVHTREVRLSCW